MQEDKLKDFERAEYYKQKLKSKKGFFVVWSILLFLLGFFTARIIYKSIPEAFHKVRDSQQSHITPSIYWLTFGWWV